MKKLASLSAIVLLIAVLPAPAMAERDFVDEQWSKPSSDKKGYHSAAIREAITPMAPMWRAENWESTGLRWRMCNSLEQSWCKNPDRYKFDAHYPACTEINSADCIVSLRITSSEGTTLDATFERYAFLNHPNAYKGNGKEVFRDVANPSIWSVTNAAGLKQQYLVSAGLSGYYGDGQFGKGNFAQVIPVQLISTEFNSPERQVFSPIPSCRDEDCGGGDNYQGQRCALFTDDGFCAKTEGFIPGERVELAITMTLQPNGWFHGRVKDPNISITKQGAQTLLQISAEPVAVPILFVEGQYENLPTSLKRYFDTCVPARTCVYGSAFPDMEGKPKTTGAERNIQAFYWPNTKEAVDAVGLFASYAKDQSPASPSTWKFETLDFRTRDYPSGCFKTNDGLQGIVTTNATAYLDGPPRLRGGFLNYEVAGLHKDRSGDVFKGTYDLVMRSDVARCLYRLTKAPVSATITVVGDGSTDIATTVVGERNGWLKLSAYGFTFSKKTIKVKLTQKKTTITCVSTNKPIKTRKVTALAPKCPTGFKKA